MSMSWRMLSKPPTEKVVMTNWAPSRAWSRSVVADTVSLLSRRAAMWAAADRIDSTAGPSTSMSMSSQSANGSWFRKSTNRLGVQCVLAPPTIVILAPMNDHANESAVSAASGCRYRVRATFRWARLAPMQKWVPRSVRSISARVTPGGTRAFCPTVFRPASGARLGRRPPVRQVGGRERRQLLGRRGPAEEVALSQEAAQRPQCVGLAVALHSFGHDRQSQRVAQGDDRAHDGGVVRVGVDLADEGPVHLERLHRELLQVAERGVAGAEVVHLEVHPELAQRLEQRDRWRTLAHHHALGDLEPQLVGGEIVTIEGVDHDVVELGVGELPGRYVDRHVEATGLRPRLGAQPVPLRRLAAG